MTHTFRLLAVLVSWLALSACDCMLYDNLAHCPQSVRLHLYYGTPCNTLPQYEALSRIKQVYVDVYGDDGRHITRVHKSDLGVLSAGTFIDFTLPQEGEYHFVVSGADRFDTYTPAPNPQALESKILTASQERYHNSQLSDLYFGQYRHYRTGDRSHTGSVVDTLGIMMSHYTQSIDLQILGLIDGQYTASISLPTGSILTDGSYGKEALTFGADLTSQELKTPVVSLPISKITDEMLEKLSPEIIITDPKGQRINLKTPIRLKDWIRAIEAKEGTSINIGCLRRIPITITLEHEAASGTYMATRVRILDWNLVTRHITFE